MPSLVARTDAKRRMKVGVLREVIEVSGPAADAFDAVADFSSSERWDPGVVRAERVRDGSGDPSGVGAKYLVRVRFRGSEQDMTYVTTEYWRPHRVVLRGEGPRVKAVDTIEFAPVPGGTRITYEADLRLTGLATLAAPFLGGAFSRMGKAAIAGMKDWLGAPPSGPSLLRLRALRPN
jgi:hypothetical protein